MSKDLRTLSERKLLQGWTTAVPRTRVRLATTADLPVITRLLPEAGVDLGERVEAGLAEGTVGQAHRAALAQRGENHGTPGFLRAMAEAFAVGPDTAYLAATVVLVAEHREDGVLGVVVAFPPPNVAERLLIADDAAAQHNLQVLVQGVSGLAKVSALVVDSSARRRGVGAALLSAVRRLFFYHGYLYVYGQMPQRPGLADFYAAQGFQVYEPGQSLDLWTVFGVPGGIVPEQGEQLFVRGRPRSRG
ncbi:GNAT family N-acetyltransferase [Crossiella sp. SN42]|uniref:GNAT family N-acetyltransferase n=1 Tax=Crossiella sp. SN42 TaxID=2944808 RepID=UPI00207D65A2|nr:GNAT family N-acetyltransferase [Crossiella sp. SN42]MCO1575140.1 GNAT family N-acetyltransferase [Crossiella sp. SN42]